MDPHSGCPLDEPGESNPAIDALLEELREGDALALQRLFVALYEDLHERASAAMAGQRRDHTLQATALVNEAYMRILAAGNRGYQDRDHFLIAASKAMRHILIDHYRSKTRLRRPQGRLALDLSHIMEPLEESVGDLDALGVALDELGEKDEQGARIVELRFFGEVEMLEIARILDMPIRSLERRWTTLKAWLKIKLA